MKYELKNYNQGVTDAELLDDVKRVQNIIGDNYLSISAYKEHGKYSATTLQNRFGSWGGILEKLGLRTERNSREMQRISDEELINDLIKVSHKLNKKKITSSEYEQYGNYAFITVKERFGSWDEFVKKADLEQTGFIKKIETVELLNEIEHIWISLGKQPTTTDMKKGISKYSLDTFTRRFGGWRNALQAFIDYINDDSTDNNEIENSDDNDNSQQTNSENAKLMGEKELKNKIKRTSRNVNSRLRFRVLERDKFKCCYCGASPAKDGNVVLHVDHIVPWAKGGETVIDNLRTSCSTCNLGKGDMDMPTS